MPSTTDRRKRGRFTLAAYDAVTYGRPRKDNGKYTVGGDVQTLLTDCLVDLMHYADGLPDDVDFTLALETAQMHHHAETTQGAYTT